MRRRLLRPSTLSKKNPGFLKLHSKKVRVFLQRGHDSFSAWWNQFMTSLSTWPWKYAVYDVNYYANYNDKWLLYIIPVIELNLAAYNILIAHNLQWGNEINDDYVNDRDNKADRVSRFLITKLGNKKQAPQVGHRCVRPLVKRYFRYSRTEGHSRLGSTFILELRDWRTS